MWRKLLANQKRCLKGKNPHTVALGRLGGQKGGSARANKLTPEERKQITKKAAQARWAK